MLRCRVSLLYAYLYTTVLVCVWALHGQPVDGATIDPNDKGLPLFPEDHPNITFFTDKNWDDIMSAKNDKPWLVDFYHPFCPHCKHFVPTYNKIAAFYKQEGSIYVGAVSCMDQVKCRRVGITGFPTLIAWNFDKRHPGKENDRVIGTHTLEEAKEYINKLIEQGRKNSTGIDTDKKDVTAAPEATKAVAAAEADDKVKKDKADKGGVRPGEEVRSKFWEETNATMTSITRLQDAGSAFVFGLKQGVFMGREVLEDFELDALKAWLQVVSQTFPGAINRKLLTKLYTSVAPIALLDFDQWDKLVKDWQSRSSDEFKNAEAALDLARVGDIPEWQRISNLFIGEGNTYRACASYTCGQWTLFHLLAVNGKDVSDEVRVSVMTSTRRFMKYFFGCVQCKEHFLGSNSLAMLRLIAKMPNKQQSIPRWLWQTHNAVNKRLWHPQRPKKEECADCGIEGKWTNEKVDSWYRSTYAYKEVDIPAKRDLENEPKEEIDEHLVAGNPGAITYHPKNAEMDIKNQLHQLHKIKEQQIHKQGHGLLLQHNIQAPRFTVFAWYFVPVFALGAYLWFVRSRARARHLPHRANN